MTSTNNQKGCKIEETSVNSVLITTDYLPPSSGGVERVVTELALELDQLGVDITILSLEDGSEELRESNVSVKSVPSLNLTDLLGVQARISPLYPFILIWLLFTEDFDIVHSHNRFFFSTWITSIVLWLLPSAPSLVTTVHLGNVRGLKGSTGTVAQLIEKTIGRIVFHQSSTVIGVSEAALESVSNMTDKCLTKTVYNGVDTDLFRPGSTFDGGEIKDTPFEILFVGRLVENKGIIELLDAISDLETDKEWVLTIVGKGPLYDFCHRVVQKRGLSSQVEFRGFVDSVPDVMQSADLFCRPSETEGLPLTLLEAMASGLPPVVTPVGGVEEVIDSGENGIIVSPDPTTIQDAIESLINNDNVRENIGKNARESVLSDYSWSKRAENILLLYDQLKK